MSNTFIKIRSRHPSHSALRRTMRNRIPTVVRFGSATAMPREYYEINKIDACMNSANKREMKRLFAEHNVKTAIWCYPTTMEQLNEWITSNELTGRIIIKSLRGSRGKGLYLKNNPNEVIEFFRQKSFGNYIVEKFYDYNREYRLHVSKNGCFYTCRKVLKSDTPADRRWFRNDSNSNWILEENELFDKPVNWQTIEQECVKALHAVGLDLGACDVRVQSANRGERIRENPDFIICEINSAPSFGEVTLTKYKNEIQRLCADYLDTLGNGPQNH